VAAHLEPDILIIDEVLAVGDVQFQKKCLGKMEEVSHAHGRTILFVSHNMAAVENLCKWGILLNAGEIISQRQVTEVLRNYQNLFDKSSVTQHISDDNRKEAAYFKSIDVKLVGEQPSHSLQLTCEILSREKHKDAFLAFDISNSIGVPIMQAIPVLQPFLKHSNGRHTLTIEIALPPLIPDVYKISAWIGSHNTETISWDKEVAGFEILESPTRGRNFPHAHSNGFIVPHSKIIHG